VQTLPWYNTISNKLGSDKHHPVVEESQEPAPPGYEPGPSATHDRAEPPPAYTEGEPSDPQRIQQARRNRATSRHHEIWDLETWRQYIEIYPPSKKPWDERDAKEKFHAASSLFSAIAQGKEDVIAFLIENDIVTPNTKRVGGLMFGEETEDTPLLQAIIKKNVRVVQQLLDLGADKDVLGSAVS
jgi:hypothetical protein